MRLQERAKMHESDATLCTNSYGAAVREDLMDVTTNTVLISIG